MAVPPTSSKTELRREMRARRAAFVAGLADLERAELLAALARNALPLIGAPKVVGSYRATGDEIDPVAIEAALTATLALPRAARNADPLVFHAGAASESGIAGIRQPSADAPVVVPDVLLVPLVAADVARNRLGQGAGHYDRYIAAHRPRSIGLAWDVQVVEALPVDAWDVPLDAIVTPTRVFG
jgi:5-formyltetrahydrofolate cyclo-ligase